MNESIVLSTTELDIIWEAEKLGRLPVPLTVPSPGTTHTERAEIADKAWAALDHRGLADRRRVAGDVLDLLGVLAAPSVSVDVWLWADSQICGFAAATGHHAALGVLDGDEVWLIPARPNALADAAVSVIGQVPPGVGQAVSVPHHALVAAAATAGDDAHAVVTALEDRGVELYDAQELAGMLLGTVTRGQFGVEHTGPAGRRRSAGHVVAFHDTDAGRYLAQVDTTSDGVDWCTIAPADTQLLTDRVTELVDRG